MLLSMLAGIEVIDDGFLLGRASAEEPQKLYIKPFYFDEPDPSPKPGDHGCFLWQEDSGNQSFWHLGIVNKDKTSAIRLNGTIRVHGDDNPHFKVLRVENVEANDEAEFREDRTVLFLDLNILVDRYDKVLFLFKGDSLEFNLTINREFDPGEFFIGKERTNPKGNETPFMIELVHKYIISDVDSVSEEFVAKDLFEPIAVTVQDEMANSAPEGITVGCKVYLPSGNVLTLEETTDTEGKAYILFRLEEKAGDNNILLRIYDDEDPKEVIIEGLPDEANRLEPISPTVLYGALGGTLDEPLSVRVLDRYDNPLPGMDVRFRVEDNGFVARMSSDGTGNTSTANWQKELVVRTSDVGESRVWFKLDDTETLNTVKASLGNSTEIPFVAIFEIYGSGDIDNDGIPDDADSDKDGDGVVNALDAFPDRPEASVDEDGDGKPERWNDLTGSEFTRNTGLTLADLVNEAEKVSKDGVLKLDFDTDGDGIPDDDEINKFGTDPTKYTRFRGRPYIYDVVMNPDPNDEGITEYEKMKVSLIIIDAGNLSSIEIHYKTFASNYKVDGFSNDNDSKQVFRYKKGDTASTNKFYTFEGEEGPDKGLQIYEITGDVMEAVTGRYYPYPLPNKHQSDDSGGEKTWGRVMNWTYEFDIFSTGEKVDFYFVLTYEGEEEGTNYQFNFPAEDDQQSTMSFRVSSSANIKMGTWEEFCYMYIPVLIIGSLASRRLRKKLATVRFRDVRWNDVQVKEVFFTVKKLFSDTKEVKQLLKRGTGKIIRLIYFLGVTGLLLLSLELFMEPKNFLLVSAVYIGITLALTVMTPVLYVYFARWKHKSPTVGKLRLLFLLVFPFAIGSAISSQQYEWAYTLVFFFLFFIPLAMYANLIGSNWNFLLFNSHRVFRHGFDYLTNAKVGIGERIGTFFFFMSVFFMPIVSFNNIYGAYDGSYEDGGFIGRYTVVAIREMGTEWYIQIFARFVGILIVLNVVILGVAMVFRVIQLQFYSSQKFAGRFGLGYRNYHTLKHDQVEQRRLIAFCFFVFFGYSVLLLLLTIYSYFAYLLPVLPYLSRDILDFISFRLSLAHNLAFLFFWLLSISKIRTVWRLKGYFDGFVIRLKK